MLLFLQKQILPRLRRLSGQSGWQHKIHALDGGIDPWDHKLVSLQQQPVQMPSAGLPLPAELVIPLKQHQGPLSLPLVKVGDYVYRNQRIAEAFGERGIHQHAPTSGTVVSINRMVAVGAPAAGNSRSWQEGRYQQVPAIVIATDGKHAVAPDTEVDATPWQKLSSEQLLRRVIDAGICGMGGAGFPSATKLSSSGIHTVVINGAECEPWITADEALMHYQPARILEGADIITAITGAQRCLIAIEDNKSTAITAMREALNARPEGKIQLALIPSLYPSGSEKQLVRIVTGIETPSGQHPTNVGVLCHSVATARAVADAVINQQPLVSRMTTVTGPGILKPQNIEALIGTPVSELLAVAGLKAQSADAPLLVGGPMMGYPAPSKDVPLAKTFNCLLVDKAAPAAKAEPHRDCIRCDFCASACPVKLQPQTLYFLARHERHEEAKNLALFDCIECGTCAAVCPSKIPLVSYYREQKAAIRELDSKLQQSEHWRRAFEHNRSRLQALAVEQEQRRLEKLQHKLEALDSGETLSRQPVVQYFDPVAQSIDQTEAATEAPLKTKTPEQIRAEIEAAVARTRARKAALQQGTSKAGADSNGEQN